MRVLLHCIDKWGGGKALSFLKKFPLFNLILEKGEETEKERERNMNVGEKH